VNDFNDDGAGLPNLNSQLAVTLPADGTYRIEVRSWDDRSGGAYTLIIDSQMPQTPTPSATRTASETRTPTVTAS